jgi:hypothetical protein
MIERRGRGRERERGGARGEAEKRGLKKQTLHLL